MYSVFKYYANFVFRLCGGKIHKSRWKKCATTGCTYESATGYTRCVYRIKNHHKVGSVARDFKAERFIRLPFNDFKQLDGMLIFRDRLLDKETYTKIKPEIKELKKIFFH